MVSAGARHSCAVGEAGEVVCWGDNVESQLGTPGPAARPWRGEEKSYACETGPSGESVCWPLGADGQRQGKYVAVSAGFSYTCGLRESGALDCWGGERAGSRPWNPEEMEGRYRGVGASRFMTCALRTSGEAVCWLEGTSLGAGDRPVFTLTTGGP